jgi:hypothetical protein
VTLNLIKNEEQYIRFILYTLNSSIAGVVFNRRLGVGLSTLFYRITAAFLLYILALNLPFF